MDCARPDPSSVPADWPHYLETVLHFGEPAVWSVPVRRFAVEAAKKPAGLDVDGSFAVITAFHPHPWRLDPEENLARHRQLRVELSRRGLHAIPCAGSSKDGSHREDGFAIACPRVIAAAIARRFGQAAFYWWDGADLWIDPALSGFTAMRISP
jgi:hypothetical protein